MMGELMGRSVDRASNADKSWFAQHRGETRRLRFPYPGEFDLLAAGCIAVEVIKISETQRARIPIFPMTEDEPGTGMLVITPDGELLDYARESQAESQQCLPQKSSRSSRPHPIAIPRARRAIKRS